MVVCVGFEGVCVREVVSGYEAPVPVVAVALDGDDQRVQGLHHLMTTTTMMMMTTPWCVKKCGMRERECVCVCVCVNEGAIRKLPVVGQL